MGDLPKGTPPVGKRPTIFLAYSHADRDQVLKLYEDLRIAGFNPWLDTENLLPGQMWHRVIDDAIRRSDAIVLCLSQRSVSRRGFFQKELRTALDQARTRPRTTPYLIPVRLDNVSIPSEIGTLQFLDYFHTDGPERLVQVLRLLAEGKSSAEPERAGGA